MPLWEWRREEFDPKPKIKRCPNCDSKRRLKSDDPQGPKQRRERPDIPEIEEERESDSSDLRLIWTDSSQRRRCMWIHRTMIDEYPVVGDKYFIRQDHLFYFWLSLDGTEARLDLDLLPLEICLVIFLTQSS